MSRPRASVEHLKLTGAQNSAIVARQLEGKPTLSKREDVEQLFADTKLAYELAADDVRVRGTVLSITKYTSKGHPYDVEIINPNYRVMSKASAQLAALAKLLSKFDATPQNAPEPGTVAAMFPNLVKERVS